MADKPYILEAHRGVGTDAPENTLAALKLAKEQGYGMIEVDTKFTSDDRCVLLHDNTVNRTGRNADGSEIAPDTKIMQSFANIAATAWPHPKPKRKRNKSSTIYAGRNARIRQ